MTWDAPLQIPDSERFDPPVTRVEWRTAERQRFSDVIETLRTHLDEAAVERLLRHRGLQIRGRTVGCDDAPEALEAGTRVVAWALAREPEAIAIGHEHLLLDEAGVVAVAKPAWLPVQGTRASQLFSLEEALRALLRCPELRAVHRLDRETSGVVLFARDAATASVLGRALAARHIRRTYLAVVSPPPEERFEIEGLMQRVPDPRRFRFALASAGETDGRPSHTRFRRLEVRGGGALVQAEPATGRTHQIRVHLAAAGSPIVGDRLYGVPGASPGSRCLLHAASTSRCLLHAASTSRCLLHALRVSLTLPGSTPREVAVEAPLPEDFGAAGFASPR